MKQKSMADVRMSGSTQDVAATDEQPRGQQNIAKRGTGIKATNFGFKCD